MATKRTLNALTRSVERLEAAEIELARARAARNKAVRAHLADEGTTVPANVSTIARLTGLTRQAIMKIRDAEGA